MKAFGAARHIINHKVSKTAHSAKVSKNVMGISHCIQTPRNWPLKPRAKDLIFEAKAKAKKAHRGIGLEDYTLV